MTLKEVGIMIDKKLRTRKSSMVYHVDFSGVETKTSKASSILHGASGRGGTLREAKRDYAEDIAGKLLVIHAYREDRREVQLPPKVTA